MTAKKYIKIFSEKPESKKPTQKNLNNETPTDKNMTKSPTQKTCHSKVRRTKILLKTLTTKILIARSCSEAIQFQKNSTAKCLTVKKKTTKTVSQTQKRIAIGLAKEF